MRAHQRTIAANCVLGAATPVLLVAGLATAGWLSLSAMFAWAARDGSWLLSYGSVTIVALALPVAVLAGYERWQVKRGSSEVAPSSGTRTLNWACGLFATALGIVVCPIVLFCTYFAWAFWQDGVPAATAWFTVVAAAVIAEPFAFLLYYDRWQTRNGLQ